MKNFNFKVFLFALCTGASSASMAGSIAGSFSDGDVLTATKMNEVSSAVNDNDSRVSSLESKLPGVDWATISLQSVYLGNGVNVGSVTLSVPGEGYVLVQFTGLACVTSGDWLILAASDIAASWTVNDGHVYMYGDVSACRTFSHTRVYPVSMASDYTYYAVAGLDENKANVGDGYADIYATLTAQYMPNRY